ncbi:MAG: hypothetical protein HY271_04335 [Deltaproteobacteria bacterium]|nr:hypothetical protein [Deltaproteobacteria bacterium]
MESHSKALAYGLAATWLGLAHPPRASAVDFQYSLPTSTPEGLAVCSFRSKVKRVVPGTALQLTLSPSMGEAVVEIGFLDGSSGFAGAGVQPGCDIFPDSPSTFGLPVPVPPTGSAAPFTGLLEMHAHPGTDCASGGQGEGMVTVVLTGASGPKLAPLKHVRCDQDGTHGNLRLMPFTPPTGTRGETLFDSVRMENRGPGDATGVVFAVKIPKTLFPMTFTADHGTCHFDFKRRELLCDLDTIPPFGVVNVELDVIPLKQGKASFINTVAADNDGMVFDKKEKITSDIAKGSSAILTVEVKCKGAAGTVTIDPNANGGKTTCTCPDPNDATRDSVTCIEIYDQKTTVTLTPAATTGQFDKWKGACAGNPAACSVTLDPAAQHPDVSTTAKFK